MRITKETVQRLSDVASEMTDGRFRIQGMGNAGDGFRILNGAKHGQWSGRDACRMASAYYFGVIDSANPGLVGDLPEDVRKIGRELVRWREPAVDIGREDYWASVRAAELGRKG